MSKTLTLNGISVLRPRAAAVSKHESLTRKRKASPTPILNRSRLRVGHQEKLSPTVNVPHQENPVAKSWLKPPRWSNDNISVIPENQADRRSHHSLIRTEQVARLPQLDEAEKRHYTLRVRRFWDVLNSAHQGEPRYTEAYQRLVQTSQQLMEGMKNFQMQAKQRKKQQEEEEAQFQAAQSTWDGRTRTSPGHDAIRDYQINMMRDTAPISPEHNPELDIFDPEIFALIGARPNDSRNTRPFVAPREWQQSVADAYQSLSPMELKPRNTDPKRSEPNHQPLQRSTQTFSPILPSTISKDCTDTKKVQRDNLFALKPQLDSLDVFSSGAGFTLHRDRSQRIWRGGPAQWSQYPSTTVFDTRTNISPTTPMPPIKQRYRDPRTG